MTRNIDQGAAAAAPPPATSPKYAEAPACKPAGGGSRPAAAHPAVVSVLPSVPCTAEFRPAGPELTAVLPYPHVPRAAGGAVDAQHPHPTPPATEREAKMTPLQAHVGPFFDRDGDGLVFPSDTWRGFHDIGFNFFLAAVATAVIHANFSFFSSPSVLAFCGDLFRGCPLHIDGLDRCLHGSHSGTYDTEGRYIPARFEDIFSKYGDKEKGGGLTWRGVLTMLGRQRSISDPVGATAAFLEWGALYWLAADHDEGVLSKEDVRMMYDGRLWNALAQRTAARRAGRKDGGRAGGHHGAGKSAAEQRPHAA